MRQRTRLTVLLAGLGLVSTTLLVGPASVEAAAPAAVTVTVTGAGIETWPAYDASLGRFAIDTGPGTDGVVEVTITTDDPPATARVDGADVETGAPHRVTGPRAGDEVNVQVSSGAVTTN